MSELDAAVHNGDHHAGATAPTPRLLRSDLGKTPLPSGQRVIGGGLARRGGEKQGRDGKSNDQGQAGP